MATGIRRIADQYKWIAKGYGICLAIGSSEAPLKFADRTDRAVAFFTQPNHTSDTQTSYEFASVGTGVSGNVEMMKVNYATAAIKGGWVNALFARCDLTTTGGVAGLASALCAEMSMPDTQREAGTYTVLELEFDVTTASSNTPMSFIYLALWGTAATTFDRYGYFFDLHGATAGVNSILSLTSQTMKCIVEDDVRYMVLSRLQDGLGLGITGTRQVLAATTNRAIACFATATHTTGTQAFYEFQMTSAGVGGIVEGMQVILTTATVKGGWINAFFAKTDMSTTGGVAGSACAICAELGMPDTQREAGTYTVLQLEFDAQTCSSNTPTSFITMNLWGTAAAAFSSYGYIFDFSGLTAGGDNVLSTTANGTTDAWLRVRINAADYWLMLSSVATEA